MGDEHRGFGVMKASLQELPCRAKITGAAIELTVVVEQRDELLQIMNGSLSDGMCLS
jgi:hypothetical protein